MKRLAKEGAMADDGSIAPEKKGLSEGGAVEAAMEDGSSAAQEEGEEEKKKSLAEEGAMADDGLVAENGSVAAQEEEEEETRSLAKEGAMENGFGASEDLIGAAASKLSDEIRELSLGTSGEIERILGPPSPLRFLRDFVMPGKPCIIAHALDHWPALRLWSNHYLRSILQDQLVSVHFTPDGYADALVDLSRISSLYDCSVADLSLDSSSSSRSPVDSGGPSECPLAEDERSGHAEALSIALERHPPDAFADEVDGPSSKGWRFSSDDDRIGLTQERQNLWFVTAHVERLPFPAALDFILGSRNGSSGVAYAQQQNGCFLSEYGLLAADAEVHIPWATEALGCMPEAVNLWIGNERAVTSFHKDHYENLYAVVAGEKHFTLLPPTDVHRLYLRRYPSAHYTRAMHSGKFLIVQDTPQTSIPWVSVDPYPPPLKMSQATTEFPRYFGGPKPFTCTVQAGEILYLPSMWFHHVRQSPDSEGRTIALNFWYDMQFDVKYAYFNFLESLISRS